ncbi:MAG: SAF domain-containing protein [Microthrixaceae bacterium]
MALAATTASRYSEATHLAARWDTGAAVLVATRHIQAGASIKRSDLSVRHPPDALTPSGALGSLPDGAVALADIANGEMLVAARVGPATAPVVPPGTSSVRLEPAVPAPSLEVGDLVDVLAWSGVDTVWPAETGSAETEAAETGSAETGSDRADPRVGDGTDAQASAPGAVVVATAAVVLVAPSGEDTSLTAAVARHDVPATAAAALGSGVVVVLRGG